MPATHPPGLVTHGAVVCTTRPCRPAGTRDPLLHTAYCPRIMGNQAYAQLQAGSAPRGADTLVQRQEKSGPVTPTGGEAPAEDDVAEQITAGAGIIVDELKKNAEFKKLTDDVTKDAKRRALRFYSDLSAPGKAALWTWGGATLGVVGGAVFSNPGLRSNFFDLMEGQNLALPLTWITPYMPITSLSYKRPETGAAAGLGIDATITATPYLDLLRKQFPGFPPFTLDLDLKVGYDAEQRDVGMVGGKLKITVYKGFSVTAGTGIGLPPYLETIPTPGGGTATSVKSLPAPAAEKQPTGTGFMISVDLMKLGVL